MIKDLETVLKPKTHFIKEIVRSAFFTCFLIIYAHSLPAQGVTFTNQSSLLGPFSGFGYSSCAVDMNGDYLDDVVRTNGQNLYIDYQDPNLG